MAIEPGFIGNNSGMGQGTAFVLPNSRTESYAIQLNQERAAQQRAQAIAAQKQMQEQNDLYAKHLYDSKIPEHNALWDAAINPMFEQYTKDAADYHAKTGKDSFAQPEFVQRRNDIVNMASNSKQAAQKAVALSTLINNDKDNKLDPNDKLKIAQALVAYNNDPVKNYSALDGLTASAKPYDITDAQKLLKPVGAKTGNGVFNTTVPNRHSHVIQSQEVLADPKFDQLKVKNGINPVVGDVFSIEDVTGTHYPTDEPTVRRFVQQILEHPELPGSQATLEAAGVTPTDPFAEQKLTELGMKQNAGYGKLVSQLADYADSRVATDKTRVYGEENNNRANRSLALSEQANARAKKKAAGDDVTYFQDLSERMRTATPGSGEEFNEQIAKNPDYLHGIKINNQDPANVVIDIPAKMKPVKVTSVEDGKDKSTVQRVVEKPGYRITLDSTDPQLWTAGLAKVYKDLTGDTFASPSKALTQSGKGKVPGGMNPVNKTKEPAENKSYKASNGKSYSNADLLKMGYTSEQIKQAISLGTLK